MAHNFATLLLNRVDGTLESFPPIQIDIRVTDKKILYNKNLNRLDRMAGDFYEDESLWKVILWANPEYEYEYDIPDNTIIRIPWPKNDVLDEVSLKIVTTKDLG
jgi:hypothetical protein